MAAVLAFAAAPAMAVPSLGMSVDKTRAYLGETIVINVTLNDSPQNPGIPRFDGMSPGNLEYRDSQSSSMTQISIVNGRREMIEKRSITYIFTVTPENAGVFTTGTAMLQASGKTLRASPVEIEVIAPEQYDFAKVSLSCREKKVLTDGEFRLEVAVELRALPPPNDDIEPIHPDMPLSLAAAFLDFPEVDGLKVPTANDALKYYVEQRQRKAAFSINGYRSSALDMSNIFNFDFGTSLQGTPLRFRTVPETIEHDGTNWWRYVFAFDYVAQTDGKYRFGPVALRGGVVTGGRRDGTPVLQEIYTQAPAIEVVVEPPPLDGRPLWFCGAAGRSLEAKASLDTAHCKVGDPLTLSLDLTGEINAMALRPPKIEQQPGFPKAFRVYGEHIDSEDIEGGKRFKYRLRPLEAGTLELPAIKAAFYDTATGEYRTVATAAIPIQVEATTQIAVAGGENDEAGDAIIPDGIIYSARDDTMLRLPGIGCALDAEVLAGAWPRWLLLPPGVFFVFAGLARFVRWCKAHLWATRYARRARRSWRRYARACAVGDAGKALAASRSLAAALLQRDVAAATVEEFRRDAPAAGYDAGAVAEFATCWTALEAATIGGNGDRNAWRQMPRNSWKRDLVRHYCYIGNNESAPRKAAMAGMLLAVGAFLIATGAMLGTSAIALEQVPDQFEWERAQDSMSIAQTPDDFADAARWYESMIENGAATGALYHNLGVARLLSGEPRSAVRAFDRAFRWRGASPELLRNRALTQRAIAADDKSASHEPSLLPRIIPPIKWRVAITVASWCALWLIFGICKLTAGGARLRDNNKRLAHPGGITTSPHATSGAIATVLMLTAFLLAGTASAQEELRVHAYTRPEKIFAGQNFEICFDIPVAQTFEIKIRRLSGLPEDLSFGEPRNDGIGTDAVGSRICKIALPAWSAAPMHVQPADSKIELALKQRRQTIFGISVREYSTEADVDLKPFEILPLPDNGKPPNFSGAVGKFALEMTFEPQTLAIGDIARLELKLRGHGRLNGATLSPPPFDSSLFKVYSADPPQPEENVSASIALKIVALSTQAVEVAGCSFNYFDPETGRYSQADAAPLAITVGERTGDSTGSVKTIDLGSNATAMLPSGNAASRIVLRLAPGNSAMPTHEVGADGLIVLEEAPGGWKRVLELSSGKNGWMPSR